MNTFIHQNGSDRQTIYTTDYKEKTCTCSTVGLKE